VEALNEGVVQDEHDTSDPPRWPPVPEEHLANIAYIFDLGVAETELPVQLSVSFLRIAAVGKGAYQMMSEVYRTKPATANVIMIPGTRPRYA